jgi:predicted MFS family arabinose efflux permease
MISLKRLFKIPTGWEICLGISFESFGYYAISSWIIDLGVRIHPDMPIQDLLIIFSIVNGTAYVLGVWLRGVFADKWGKKSRRAYALLPTSALFLVLLVSSSLFRLAMFGYQLV